MARVRGASCCVNVLVGSLGEALVVVLAEDLHVVAEGLAAGTHTQLEQRGHARLLRGSELRSGLVQRVRLKGEYPS